MARAQYFWIAQPTKRTMAQPASCPLTFDKLRMGLAPLYSEHSVPSHSDALFLIRSAQPDDYATTTAIAGTSSHAKPVG
jgi:hypothetical protein